jgi:hypothetical protein
VKYVETAAKLFNKGRFELASKYLDAAQMYRDRLTANEQIVLDVYREKLERYYEELKEAKAAKEAPTAPAAPPSATQGKTADAGVKPASTVGVNPLELTADRASSPTAALGSATVTGLEGLTNPVAPATGPSTPPAEDPAPRRAPPPGPQTETLRETPDAKQKARWMLHEARDQILRNQFDAAARTVAEVQAMGIKWGYFDDTPAKVTETLTKARAKAARDPQGIAAARDPQGVAKAGQPRDRRTAKARLRDARAALAANEVDKAEAIVHEVGSWDLRYGWFDDTPEKVSVAVSEARQREAVRNAELMVRSYLGTAADRGRPEDSRSGQTTPATPEAGSPAPR